MFGLSGRWILCGCLGVSLAACGGDFADGGVDADGTGAGTTGADTSATSLTGPDDSGGDDSTGGSDPTGGASGEDLACLELDCGVGGSCSADENGAPMCVCTDGFASIGYACLPCDPAPAQLDLDVPKVIVGGRVTINEAAPPPTELEDGNLYLRNAITGDEVYLGSTHDGEVQASVVPGTYDIIYAHESGGSQTPANRGVRLDTRFVDDTEPLDIDITMIPLIGMITINGETPPDSPVENGRVYLFDPASGDEVPLAETRAGSFEVNLVPGRYEVHYGRIASSTIAPANADAKLFDVEIQAGEVIPALDIDIPAVTVSAPVTVGGDVPVDSPVENGRITLRDPQTDSEIEIAQTRHGSYDFVVIPGAYEVYYSRIAGSTQVPANKRARLYGQFELNSDSAPTIDVPIVELSGAFTIGGDPPPSSNSDDGVVSLRNPDTSDVAVLGNTHNGSYSRLVVPGDYDVYYSQETAGAVVPANVGARLEPLSTGTGVQTANIDIPVVDVQGTITVDGDTPPTSEYSDGRIYLRNLATGDSVLLGNTRLASFDARVVPGVYDVVYVVETAGAGVPVNAAASLDSVDVAAQPVFSVDVPTIDLTGAITIGGSMPPTTVEDHGVLLLEDVRTADAVFLGDTRDGGYATTITSGEYVVWYRAASSTGEVPQNTNVGVRCIQVAAP